MPIAQHELEATIKQAFPEAEIIVKDLMGDSDHYSLEIKSELFKGKSRVEQHKMVNSALKGCLGEALHALTIKTSA